MFASRIACFGGVYNNYLAIEAAVRDARRRGVDAMYCLGDLGAFGPHPDRVFPLLRDNNVLCVQGNYDDSIGNSLDDCQCGYTDPRDNHFAQLSYEYTRAKKAMFFHTDTADSPWTVVKSDNKKRARLNAMRYVLHSLPYTVKDVARVGSVDGLLVGRANFIHERGEHDLTSGRYVGSV